MSKVLIIGCGGVASVAIHKCCQVPEVFTEICIASRTKAKCDKLAAELPGRLICTGAVKMLFQIFTVVPDQRQRAKADLLDPLLLIRRK